MQPRVEGGSKINYSALGTLGLSISAERGLGGCQDPQSEFNVVLCSCSSGNFAPPTERGRKIDEREKERKRQRERERKREI